MSETMASSSRRWLWPVLLLVIATAVAYGPITTYGFTDYDDPEYVTENRHVRDGITVDGLVWAFTTGHASNWHPVTWLSHMLDTQVFGVRAGGHHATNLVLHVLNAVLLFLVLRRMTGATWRSFFVGAMFALHPMHVESVAWVAERKDVLSAFFAMLAFGAYIRYAKEPSAKTYGGVIVLFVLALMAKPMLVTLPSPAPAGRVAVAATRPGVAERPRSPHREAAAALSIRRVQRHHASGPEKSRHVLRGDRGVAPLGERDHFVLSVRGEDDLAEPPECFAPIRSSGPSGPCCWPACSSPG